MKIYFYYGVVLSFILLVMKINVLGQCNNCTYDQGCCMKVNQNQWDCCAGQTFSVNSQQNVPWNFNLQIRYDNYVWDCSPSTLDPLVKYTNVSCILDGRWSLNRLTFQLRSIPTVQIKIINAEYTMKNDQTEKVSFREDSQWALTLPVDRNEKPAIYDRIQFNYGGFNYTYYFGYGPYPHCPRC